MITGSCEEIEEPPPNKTLALADLLVTAPALDMGISLEPKSGGS